MEEKKPRKPGSGGARAGAGRKTDRPKITVALNLPVDIVDWLDSIGGPGYRSQTVTLILDTTKKAEKK